MKPTKHPPVIYVRDGAITHQAEGGVAYYSINSVAIALYEMSKMIKTLADRIDALTQTLPDNI